MTPRPGTERFERLCDFLTETMEDKRASRRVRLSAAQRLDGLLQRQERRETAEARRTERACLQASKRDTEASGTKGKPTSNDEADDPRLQKAHEFLEKIAQKAA